MNEATKKIARHRAAQISSAADHLVRLLDTGAPPDVITECVQRLTRESDELHAETVPVPFRLSEHCHKCPEVVTMTVDGVAMCGAHYADHQVQLGETIATLGALV